jgi:hypothetical protein
VDRTRASDDRESPAGISRTALFRLVARLAWKNFVRAERERLQSLPGKLIRWENWLGLIFPAWLSLEVGHWMLWLARRYWAHWSGRSRAAWIVAGALWLALDVPYLLRLVFVARRGLSPFALEAARRGKLMPLPLRPIIAAWWLGHFAAPFWLVWMLAHHGQGAVRLPIGFDFLMMLIWGLTANGFLMLAVCALTPSDRVRRTAWRFRVLTDLGLAIASVGVF